MAWEAFALAYLRDMLVVLGAYGLGCACAGFYLVRWRAGEDIRGFGSGNVGAKNVGRRLGPLWFAATLLLDASKGLAAVLGARLAGGGAGLEAVALFAAVAGHVWPAQLGFRGGKGVATFVGALLALDHRVLAWTMLPACVLILLTRRFTVAGLAAFALSPLIARALDHAAPVLGGLAAAVVVMLVAHRKNLAALLPRHATQPSGPEA